MAQADTLVALVKAASSGDQPSFRKSTEALIQEERGKGHRILRESVRAKLRILVRRTLKKWKYPPVGEDAAIELVLKQAESLSNAWSK